MFRGLLPGLRARSILPPQKLVSRRWVRYEASMDPEDLAEARKWYVSFQKADLPTGQTSYSRSSGPGGQHVNKTESKATTVWPIHKLTRSLPKLMHAGLRTSRYYASGSDSLTLQAQTQRDRNANMEENLEKLAEELRRIYREIVPGVTNVKKIKRYEALEKSFNEGRIRSKKHQSTKKANRKASFGD